MGAMTTAAAALLTLGPPASAAPDAVAGQNGPARSGYVEQELLVAFDPASGAEERSSVRRRHGLERIEALPLPGLERTRIRGRGGPARHAPDVARERAVRYAQPNHLWSAQTHDHGWEPPSDPAFTALWGLHNDGSTGGTHGADISYLRGRSVAAGSEGIVVGVIDTGVAIDHADLAANVWLNVGELPAPQRADGSECRDDDCDGNGVTTVADYVDDPQIAAGCLVAGVVKPSSLVCAFADGNDTDGNGYVDDILGWDFRNDDNRPDDDHGHGTHVAGTAAAVTDNGVGVAGTSQARILPLKFLGSSGTGSTADAVKALDYAIRMGVHVTNSSWSGGSADQALSEMILAAHDRGQLFVTSAGNAGRDLDQPDNQRFPASFNHPNMITVANTTPTDALAGDSNYGAGSVHLGAPGTGIYSTLRHDGYGYRSGTSMAAPHVAGAAAAVLGGYPGIGHVEAKHRLMARGDPTSGLDGRTVSGRRLNVAGALDTDGPPALTGLTVRPGPTGPGQAARSTVRWTQSEPVSLIVRVRAASGAAVLRTEMLGARSAGSNAWAWDGTDDQGSAVSPGAYDLELDARDVAGNTAVAGVTVTVREAVEADLRPAVTSAPDPGAAGGTLSFEVRVRNRGPSEAVAVRSRAVLPREVTDVTLAGPAAAGCAYEPAPHAVFCELGSLAEGSVSRVRITGVVEAGTPHGAVLRTTYDVTSPTPDPKPRGRSVVHTTAVANHDSQGADVRAHVARHQDLVVAGEPVNYDLRVRNLGPAVAAGVTGAAELPVAVSDVSLHGSAAGRCSYDADRHAVSCAFGDLGVQDVKRVVIAGVVDATKPPGTTLRFTYAVASPTDQSGRSRRSVTRTATITAG